VNFSSWQAATNCTSGPAPGALALLDWLLKAYRPPGWSGGIYNCRTVRGGSTTSTHGEGRAVDLMLPVHPTTKRGTKTGHDIVKTLGANGRRLGIQCIIYDRMIWSDLTPGGRRYNGVHPHYDHLHIELTRNSGRLLTKATIESVLGKPWDVKEEDDVYVVKYGESGPRVMRAQIVLRAAGERAGLGDLLPKFGTDGDYGDETADAVNKMAARVTGRGMKGLPQEGETGMDILVLDYCRNWLNG